MVELVCEEVFDIDVYYKLCRHKSVGKDEKNKLHKYKKLSRDGNKVLIEYDFGKNWNTLQFGDYYAIKGIGLSSMPREIRAALSQKHYWDLDIENAHPSIIQNFCKKKGWECKVLDRFILERKEILQTICNEHKQERWWAKEECIRVFNGGYSNVHPILLELIPEIEKIRDNIIPLYSNIYKKALQIKKNESDAKVTTLSLVFQNETRILLNTISDYLKSKGRSLDVRIHDGGLVRKLKDETVFPKSLLREIEEHILEQHKYSIGLEIKPLVHSYVFNDNDEYVDANIVVNDSYACERFIELVDIVKVGSELLIFNPKTRKYDTDVKQQIINNKDNMIFKQLVGEKDRIFDYGGNSKNINALLSILPQHVKEGKMPFVFQYTLCKDEFPERDEEIFEAFQALIKLSCKGDEKKAIYRLSWYAHIIQKPYELPGTALTDSGKEGVGKDTTANFLIDYVYGRYNCAVYGNNSGRIFDKHDIGRMNKLIVKIEEPKQSVCIENQDAIKSFITSITSDFNPKNIRDPVVVENYNRFIFTTNYGCPIPITEDDRRIALYDFSDEKKGDRDFWNWIYKTLFNDYAGKVIGNFLASIDISNYDPNVLPPSEYKEAIQEESISIEKQFLTQEHDDWTDWLNCSDIYIIYKNWCRVNNCENYSANSAKSLGKRLIIPLRDGLIERRMYEGINLYKIKK